jgi:mRNA interferase HicA
MLFTVNSPNRKSGEAMKYSEFIRWLRSRGVVFERQKGSHLFVKLHGNTSVVPNHGGKEMPEPLRKKILRDLDLK